MGRCGYIDSSGKVKVPFDLLDSCYTENFKTLAIVRFKSKRGVYAIDKQLNSKFRVQRSIDPEENIEGTFRFANRSKKIGLADMEGNIILEAVFDLILGFNNLALVNLGGEWDWEGNPCESCAEFKGGKWGIFDLNGEPVLKVFYDRRWEEGKTLLERGDERYLLDIDKGVVKIN